MKATPVPTSLWAPLASIWLALAILAGIYGQLLVAAVAGTSLGLLAVALRLDALQRQRYLVLHATVALIDAKVTHLRQGKVSR